MTKPASALQSSGSLRINATSDRRRNLAEELKLQQAYCIANTVYPNMANRGYDVVVDVDQEVNAYQDTSKTPSHIPNRAT